MFKAGPRLLLDWCLSAMLTDYPQIVWCDRVADSARALIRLALAEDLEPFGDLTTRSLVAPDAPGAARITSRKPGVVAGLPVLGLVAEVAGLGLEVELHTSDSNCVVPGAAVATLRGPAATILTLERTLLNFLCRLSGIATLTRRYVDFVADTGAAIYDTRKTTPGWRLLEKYAVCCGGGRNHRLSLASAVMLKDNHLAFAEDQGLSLAAAIGLTRQRLASLLSHGEQVVIEVEVDSLDQLAAVLPQRPGIVLLDNMPPAKLAQAVALRNRVAPEVILEASGGVSEATMPAIAASGVDRISVGALTHSAPILDLGLDWCDL